LLDSRGRRPEDAPPAGEILLALQEIVSSDPVTFAFALKTDATWRLRFR
jgi:hypothetical protein